jgi:hypothetical protein
MWQFLTSSHELKVWAENPDPKLREKLIEAHLAECVKDPVQHRFTMSEFRDALRRIADTRANGALVSGSDRTVGYDKHDLSSMAWRKEAALLEWLQNGEMTRPSDERSRPNATTGLYSTIQNLEHHQKLKDAKKMGKAARKAAVALARAQEAAAQAGSAEAAQEEIEKAKAEQERLNKERSVGITGNTLSLVGMNAVSICNTRTQFGFDVEIAEQDGSAGRSFSLEATRINGIDAGWVAAGHDATLDQARVAAAWLEANLTALPGVGNWIRGHSTLVADTNNGQLVGDRFDAGLNGLVGKSEMSKEDRQAAGEARGKIAEERENAMEERFKREEEMLKTARTRVKKLQEDLEKLDEPLDDESIEKDNKFKAANREVLKARKKKLAEAKRLQEEDGEGEEGDEAERGRRLAALFADVASLDDELKTAKDNFRRSREETLKTRRATLERQLVAAKGREQGVDSRLLATTRAREVRRFITEASKKRVEKGFVDIFDYKVVMLRIRRQIIGDSFDDFTPTQVEAAQSEEAAKGLSDADKKRKQKLQQYSWWRQTWFFRPKGLGEGEAAEEYNAKLKKHRTMCLESLCHSLGIHTGSLERRNVMVLRFMAMLSPVRPNFNTELMRFASFVVPSVAHWAPVSFESPTVRTLPQLLLRQGEGPVAPVALPRSSSETFPRAVKSVDAAKGAMRRASIGSDEVLGVRHLRQVYRMRADGSNAVKRAFEPLAALLPVDSFSLSALPSRRVVELEEMARVSGGSTFALSERMAAGSAPSGLAAVLSAVGVPSTHAGASAAACFCEILVCHALARTGTIRREELVVSIFKRARAAAKAVAKFIFDLQSSGRAVDLRLIGDDVVFQCIPGMEYFRIASRRLGLDSMVSASGGRLNRTQKSLVAAFATSLRSLASSRNPPLEKLPFTSMLSTFNVVPVCVKSAETGADAHLLAVVHSYQRVVAMTASATPVTLAGIAARVDCVCCRPFVLKKVLEDPEGAEWAIAGASRSSPQRAWNAPARRTDTAHLRRRLAALRMNIGREILEQELPVESRGVGKARDANLVLQQQMLRIRKLGVDERATYVIPFGSLYRATPADVAHMEFEMHPVWTEELLRSAQFVVQDSMRPFSEARTRVKVEGPDVDGVPTHPYAVSASESSLSLFMDLDMQNMFGHLGSSIYSEKAGKKELFDTSSLFRAALAINSSPDMQALSGVLSLDAKCMMHNSERMMQTCLIVASGAHGVQSSRCVSVESHGHASGALALCASLGGALATAEAGMDMRVSVVSSTSASEDRTRARNAASALVRACESLRKAGIRAVPFSEVCLFMSTLS